MVNTGRVSSDNDAFTPDTISLYRSFQQSNFVAITNCPTVLVVATQKSGTLVTWLSLHALFASDKLRSCPPKAVYFFTYPSLVDQLQHAADTWDLPHSTPVHVLEFSRFPRGEDASSLSNQSRLLIYQSRRPVPNVLLSRHWMDAHTVEIFQETEGWSKTFPAVLDRSRTALFALPSSCHFLARSCLGDVATAEDILICVEDSLLQERDGRRQDVTWVMPRVNPSWWKAALPTAMERHPQCRVFRPTEAPSIFRFFSFARNSQSCAWLHAHKALRHTLLPFALGFELAFPPPSSVSLVTHMTFERFNRLETIVQSWAGPVSVALYAHLDDAVALSSLVASSQALRGRPNVMFHIVGLCGPIYPVNRVRNVANRFSVTPYVLIVDVDLVPSPDMFPKLEAQSSALATDPKELLVVPAVEFSRSKKARLGAANASMPLSKDQLRPLVHNGSVVFFQEESFPSGHAPTDIQKFLSSREDYLVEYSLHYEAYFVTDRLTTPPFDERYIGWGYDRLSLHAQLHLRGYRFKVLADGGFLFHIKNPKNTSMATWGKNPLECACNRAHFKRSFRGTDVWRRRRRVHVPHDELVGPISSAHST